jgi:hypothetical protein
LRNLTPDLILSSTLMQQQEWAHAIPLTRADLGRLMRVACYAILAVFRMRAILARHQRSNYWKGRQELQAQRDSAEGSKLLKLEDVYTSQLGQDLFALEAISDGKANLVGFGLESCVRQGGMSKREADIINSTTIKEHAGLEGGFLWCAPTVQRDIVLPDKRRLRRDESQVRGKSSDDADSAPLVRCRLSFHVA